MRAACERGGRLFERKNLHDAAVDEIEFGDRRCIPERDEGAIAVVSDDGGVGKRSGNALEGGEIEAPKDFAIIGRKQDGFIGVVARDENAFDSCDICNAEAGGVSDIVEFRSAKLSADICARRKWKEFLGRDSAVFKFIDGDGVASVAFFLAERIGERSDRGIEMFPIEAKGEAEKIGRSEEHTSELQS